MSGFRNCPSITEFKVGMRVRLISEAIPTRWFNVTFVGPEGTYPMDEHGTSHGGDIDLYELDLDSIWVGRWYHRKDPSRRQQDLYVVLVGNTAIGYAPRNSIEGVCCGRGEFLKQFEPVPILIPIPSVPVPEQSACSPEPEELRRYRHGGDEYTVVLVCTRGPISWIKLPTNTEKDTGWLVLTENLFPMPEPKKEPPVKVNDVVMVRDGFGSMARVEAV